MAPPEDCVAEFGVGVPGRAIGNFGQQVSSVHNVLLSDSLSPGSAQPSKLWLCDYQ